MHAAASPGPPLASTLKIFLVDAAVLVSVGGVEVIVGLFPLPSDPLHAVEPALAVTRSVIRTEADDTRWRAHGRRRRRAGHGRRGDGC